MKYKSKIILSSIVSFLWLYFRKDRHYFLVPRRNIFTAIIFSLWIYLNYIDPIALPLGLLILYINEIFFVIFFNDTLNMNLLPNNDIEFPFNNIFELNNNYRNVDFNIPNVNYLRYLSTANHHRTNLNNSNILYDDN